MTNEKVDLYWKDKRVQDMTDRELRDTIYEMVLYQQHLRDRIMYVQGRIDSLQYNSKEMK